MIKIEKNIITISLPDKRKSAADYLPAGQFAAAIYKGEKGDKGDSIKGDKGDPGLTGKQGPIGPRGPDGKDGRGIESITQPEEGIAQINYTDGTHDTIELPRGEDGREIELGYSRTHLQWRYVGETEWKNLFPIPEMWQQGEGAGSLKVVSTLNSLIGNVTISAGSNITLNTVGNNIEISSTGGGGAVDSVNGQTGVVVLDTGDIAEVVDKNYVTDADIINLGNLSGVNTGDQDLSGLQPLDADLTAIAALNTTGYAKRTGANTWSLEATIPSSDVSGLDFIKTDGTTVLAVEIPFASGVNASSITVPFIFSPGQIWLIPQSGTSFTPFIFDSVNDVDPTLFAGGGGATFFLSNENTSIFILDMRPNAATLAAQLIVDQDNNIVELVSNLSPINIRTAGATDHYFQFHSDFDVPTFVSVGSNSPLFESEGGGFTFKSTAGGTNHTLGFGLDSADITLTSSASVIDATTLNIKVQAEAYGAGWNGSQEVPTKGSLYTKIESLLESGDNIIMADDGWIGFGAASGRILFDNQATDEINILDARFGIETNTPVSILEVSNQNATSASPVITISNETGTATLDPALSFRTGASPVQRWLVGVDDSSSDDFVFSSGTGALGSANKFIIGTTGQINIPSTNALVWGNPAGSSGFIQFVGSSLRITPSNGSPGALQIGDGSSVWTIGPGTNTSNPGVNFSVAGGDAGSSSNANGGNIIVKSGIARGNGSSSILLQTVLANQGSGTTIRNPATTITLDTGLMTFEAGAVDCQLDWKTSNELAVVRGDFLQKQDSAFIWFGAGKDVKIGYTGAIWDFDVALATTSIDFNRSLLDTDFNVHGNTVQLVHFDANGATSYIKPDSNSTTAFQFQQADGTNIVNIDSTNKRVGVNNAAPGFDLDITGLINTAGTTGNTYRWNADVAAPGTSGSPTFTAYYGGNINALGDPAIWVLVNVAGTEYKCPLYDV